MQSYIAFHRELHHRFWLKQKSDPTSFLQMIALKYIAHVEAPLVKELSQYMCVSAPSATVLVNRLVATHLVRRTIDRKDKRAVRVIITAKGKHMVQKKFLEMQKQMTVFFSALSLRQQKQLTKMFLILFQSITKKS